MKIAFPTDEHFPFQDERARSVALQIVKDFDPDVRITGSDGVDFYSISKFDKNPKRLKLYGLQAEINAWRAGQREWLDAAPNAKTKFIRGNHEDRLIRYLWRHPEIADLEVLTLPSVLGLKQLKIGWEYSKGDKANMEFQVRDQLLIKHGAIVRKHSAYTARAELESEYYQINTLTGHTHRGGTTYAQTRRGLVVGMECFCLCDLDPEYVAKPNWQHGIVLATVERSGVQIEPVPFWNSGRKVHTYWRDKHYISE